MDELRVSEAMEKHAGRVMAVFDDAINAIENVDGTDEILCRAAKKHSSIEGFVSDMFWVSAGRGWLLLFVYCTADSGGSII